MPYQRKTQDEWQVQQDYGFGDGYEEVSSYPTFREGRDAYREYRQNQPNVVTRLRKVRVPIDNN